MLYRAAAVLIVIFWMTMTALLVQREFSSGTALREVPAEHVLKLLFLHGQESALHIDNNRERVGFLQLNPQTRSIDGARILELSGNLHVALPGQARQRVGWRGSLELDQTMTLRLARLAIVFRDAGAYSVDLIVDPQAKRLRYETRYENRRADSREYPLSEEGALKWLREQGIDPAILQSVHRTGGPRPSLRAWQSSINVQGHKLETYRVALEHGGQTLLEFQVNQLGGILQAKSFLGYTAESNDVLP